MKAWPRTVVYLLLYILCVVTFHGMTDNHLFNDDFSWLDAARNSMGGGGIMTTRVVGFFRPLVNASFYAMERLSPGNVPLHYSLNLLLHFICSLLVFHLFSRITGNAMTAAAGAILFAVASIHTGAVLWISARTTLLSSALLLGSILLVAGDGTRRRIAAAGLLFALALAAKETAIAGLFIVLLLYLSPSAARPSRVGVVTFSAVSAAYLVIRAIAMGGFLQANWGPGLHMARNVGGGLLYQFYPWPLFSLLWPQANHIPESSHPILPEIAALPLAILLIWLGTRSKERSLFVIGCGWALLSLLPSSLFRYRFFSTASITQNRYYYLSSVGVMLVIALLLRLLHRSRRRVGRYAAVIAFLLMTAGYIVRVDRIEKRWGEFTMIYRDIVEIFVEAADQFPGERTIAIADPPMAFSYMERAVHLERPELRLVKVGSRYEAMPHSPCLFVTYSGDWPKRMRMERLE